LGTATWVRFPPPVKGLRSELADESTWLWLTSKQMGFPLRLTGGGGHKERAKDLDSSQRVRDHLVVYHSVAPATTDFVSDETLEIGSAATTNLNRHYRCYAVNGVKRLSPRGKARYMVHSLSATHLMRKVQSSFTDMRWKAPSNPTAAYDPRLPREQETPLEIGKDWFLDQKIPAGGFVRILDSSQVWEERVDETRIMPGPKMRMDNH